eukprot:CAMPEP_0113707734 /NCGR_PEP_ID=MMETSP0038_2-20120614/28570_1 /TAXON_ID=2898 /ORGANISM="Cryptomonas paramecium" /LENGTH=258 /DNA_ID=CAMNT_0000633321 /DNA_START=73 /DNA_END=846 /DNA_ORIENTATION=- /assembly_acc=CAM_ASM_000170
MTGFFVFVATSLGFVSGSKPEAAAVPEGKPKTNDENEDNEEKCCPISENASDAPLKSARSSSPTPSSTSTRSDIFTSKSLCQGSSFLRLHKRIYFALFDAEQAAIVAQHELKQNYSLVPAFTVNSISSEGGAVEDPTPLLTIYEFDRIANAVARQNPGGKLVFCGGGASNPMQQIRSAYLVGCHLILTHGLSADRTYASFLPFHHAFEEYPLSSPSSSAHQGVGRLTVDSCWSALDSARAMGWVDFRRSFVREAKPAP